MSWQTLEAVIGRAILDEEFRSALFEDPEAALVEYELTEDEIAALKSVDAESVDDCAHNVGRLVLNGLLGRDADSPRKCDSVTTKQGGTLWSTNLSVWREWRRRFSRRGDIGHRAGGENHDLLGQDLTANGVVDGSDTDEGAVAGLRTRSLGATTPSRNACGVTL